MTSLGSWRGFARRAARHELTQELLDEARPTKRQLCRLGVFEDPPSWAASKKLTVSILCLQGMLSIVTSGRCWRIPS